LAVPSQAWDNEDVRLVRFTYFNKQVNPNVAMHLVADVPPIESHSRVVSCDGGGGALGHPKVFMNLVGHMRAYRRARVSAQDKPGNHACGYCGLRFTLAGQPNNGEHHAGV
jgi:NADH dehydrogenase (ubiquinone) Fe-S protein 6